MFTIEVRPNVTELEVTPNIVELELTHGIPSVSLANLDDDLAYSDLSTDGVRVNFVAGEDLSFGEACYMTSSGKWNKADASSYSTGRAMAMAAESISADSTGKFLLMGFARNDAWSWSVGEELYLSENSGELTQTPPITSNSTTQLLGIAINATRVYFNPSPDVLVHI
jgi:hypothetical protein